MDRKFFQEQNDDSTHTLQLSAESNIAIVGEADQGPFNPLPPDVLPPSSPPQLLGTDHFNEITPAFGDGSPENGQGQYFLNYEGFDGLTIQMEDLLIHLQELKKADIFPHELILKAQLEVAKGLNHVFKKEEVELRQSIWRLIALLSADQKYLNKNIEQKPSNHQKEQNSAIRQLVEQKIQETEKVKIEKLQQPNIKKNTIQNHLAIRPSKNEIIEIVQGLQFLDYKYDRREPLERTLKHEDQICNPAFRLKAQKMFQEIQSFYSQPQFGERKAPIKHAKKTTKKEQKIEEYVDFEVVQRVRVDQVSIKNILPAVENGMRPAQPVLKDPKILCQVRLQQLRERQEQLRDDEEEDDMKEESKTDMGRMKPQQHDHVVVKLNPFVSVRQYDIREAAKLIKYANESYELLQEPKRPAYTLDLINSKTHTKNRKTRKVVFSQSQSSYDSLPQKKDKNQDPIVISSSSESDTMSETDQIRS